MGMQKLGYNMIRRLHARSYSSQPQIPSPGPGRVPDTFLPIERAAAKVVLCTPLAYGFLFLMDFAGVRTMYTFLHDYKMEMAERESEELRAEAERRDDKDDKLLHHA